MSARTWIPAEWMDEMVPTCGASPDVFLKRSPEGVLQLAPLDDRSGEWPVAEDLQAEQIVEFCWHEDRGWAVIEVKDDGSWFLAEPFEGEANCIVGDDGDCLASSIGDYVAQLREMGALEAGRHDLSGYYWSDRIAFRVKVLESGAASFEPVLERADV